MKFCLSLIIFLGLVSFVYAKKADEIIWLQNNRPPWLISTGAHKNEGYGDKIRIFITTNYLDEYKHRLLPVNPSRALRIVKEENTDICYASIFRLKNTESFLIYSKPIYVLPQGRIIVTNEIHNKLNNIDEISMIELIQNNNYIFGKIKGIDFYPIDVKKFENQKNVITLSTSSPVVNLLNMMKRNRIDWIYDYNVFIKWEEFLNKDYKNIFKTIKVKETQNLPKSIGYIACRKNSFGKKIIDKINKNLSKSNILEMRKEIRKWQLDDSTAKEFETLNKELFGY